MTAPTSTDALNDLLAEVDGSLLVVSPFVTLKAVEHVLDTIPAAATLAVFTNWAPRAVRAGATDPRIFSPVRGHGGRVFLHPRLHGKLFATMGTGDGSGRALVGSANLTGPGTGWFGVPNLELLTPAGLDSPHVRAFLSRLRAESVEAEAADADLAIRVAESLDPTDMASGTARDAAALPPALTVSPETFLRHLVAGTLPEPLALLAESWGLTSDTPKGETIRRVGVGLVEGPYYLLARTVARQTGPEDAADQHESYRRHAAVVGIDVNDAASEWATLMEWMTMFFPHRFQAMSLGPTYLVEKFAENTARF